MLWGTLQVEDKPLGPVGWLGATPNDQARLRACAGSAGLPTHPGSHLGLLTPDSGDRIRSDLVPHLLGQVLGSLDGIQGLEGEHRLGLGTELPGRGLGSQERKGKGEVGARRVTGLGSCPVCEGSRKRLGCGHKTCVGK